MKVLIVGLPKSGTTALYAKIRQSLRGSAQELFEVSAYQPSETETADHVIAKALIVQQPPLEWKTFHHFDKKVAIVRDPRDRFVSSLLYGAFDGQKLDANPLAVERLLDLLRQKETAPSSVSVLEIYAAVRDTPPVRWEQQRQSIANEMLNERKLHHQFLHEDFSGHVVRYEDFVQGDFAALETYLEFPLTAKSEVAGQFARVARTKGCGDWKSWFTESDVAFFRPVLQPFMDDYGYVDDWTLACHPVIAPTASSLYVRGLLAERRAAKLLTARDPALPATLQTCETLLKYLRTELGPLLLEQGRLDERYDQLLRLLQIVRLSQEDICHAPRDQHLQKQNVRLEAKLAETERKLAEERHKLKLVREERNALQKRTGWRSLFRRRRRAGERPS